LSGRQGAGEGRGEAQARVLSLQRTPWTFGSKNRGEAPLVNVPLPPGSHVPRREEAVDHHRGGDQIRSGDEERLKL
jgi:hypothetical protein